MRYFKKGLLFLISLLPIQALAYAVDFNDQIDTPELSRLDVEQEFLRRLDNDLLHDKYYQFLEDNDVYSKQELLMPWNANIKQQALRDFEKELKDMTLAAGSANSMVPE